MGFHWDTDSYHFISEDTIDTVVVQGDHPVQTLNLVISHLATLDICAALNLWDPNGKLKILTCWTLLKHERFILFFIL